MNSMQLPVHFADFLLDTPLAAAMSAVKDKQEHSALYPHSYGLLHRVLVRCVEHSRIHRQHFHLSLAVCAY